MANLFLIIILITCVILSFFILIQKPKGGGLSGSFGSLGTQVMGVKQSGDIMEKGTWYSIAIIAILSIFIVFQLPVTKQIPTNNTQEQTSMPATQDAQPVGGEQAPIQ